MGGTSTDVSRFDGKLEHTFENVIAGVTVMAPQLDINTVAAGGGSILKWNNGQVEGGSMRTTSPPNADMLADYSPSVQRAQAPIQDQPVIAKEVR